MVALIGYDPSTFGLSKLYNLSRLEQVHGDFDTSFRSNEFMQQAAGANIQLSFAAPRHQEQNGLCKDGVYFPGVRHVHVSMIHECVGEVSTASPIRLT
jgi:hypothetical protein